MLHRAYATGASVADKPSCLIVPLAVDKVDRILQGAADAVVVLRRHKDISVERIDFGSPSLRVLLGVLSHCWGHWLVEQGQVEFLDIDKLKLRIGATLREFVNPLGD